MKSFTTYMTEARKSRLEKYTFLPHPGISEEDKKKALEIIKKAGAYNKEFDMADFIDKCRYIVKVGGMDHSVWEIVGWEAK